MNSRKKILITGVNGIVGGLVYRLLSSIPGKYELYGLDKSEQPSSRTPAGLIISIPKGHFTLADISQADALSGAFRGIDAVFHMAGAADPESGWEEIHQSNIVGAWHVFEACRLAGVSRIIYASSLKVVHGYLLDEPYKSIKEGRYDTLPSPIPLVNHDMPTRPVDLYSASKVWGEKLARIYADQYGISCIALRLGWVNAANQPLTVENMTLWTSHADMVNLAGLCIDAPESLRFDIFFSVSNSRFRWVDIDHARETVGYIPHDWAEEMKGF